MWQTQAPESLYTAKLWPELLKYSAASSRHSDSNQYPKMPMFLPMTLSLTQAAELPHLHGLDIGGAAPIPPLRAEVHEVVGVHARPAGGQRPPAHGAVHMQRPAQLRAQVQPCHLTQDIQLVTQSSSVVSSAEVPEYSCTQGYLQLAATSPFSSPERSEMGAGWCNHCCLHAAVSGSCDAHSARCEQCPDAVIECHAGQATASINPCARSHYVRRVRRDLAAAAVQGLMAHS